MQLGRHALIILLNAMGSSIWNTAEWVVIKQSTNVWGAEGNHQQNVADHLVQQTSPGNIKFYRSKQKYNLVIPVRDGCHHK